MARNAAAEAARRWYAGAGAESRRRASKRRPATVRVLSLRVHDVPPAYPSAAGALHLPRPSSSSRDHPSVGRGGRRRGDAVGAGARRGGDRRCRAVNESTVAQRRSRTGCHDGDVSLSLRSGPARAGAVPASAGRRAQAGPDPPRGGPRSGPPGNRNAVGALSKTPGQAPGVRRRSALTVPPQSLRDGVIIKAETPSDRAEGPALGVHPGHLRCDPLIDGDRSGVAEGELERDPGKRCECPSLASTTPNRFYVIGGTGFSSAAG